MSDEGIVWVFTGACSRFPAGIFSTLEKAESWIYDNNLSGMLTRYPIDVGAYQWAINNGYFAPKNEK